MCKFDPTAIISCPGDGGKPIIVKTCDPNKCITKDGMTRCDTSSDKCRCPSDGAVGLLCMRHIAKLFFRAKQQYLTSFNIPFFLTTTRSSVVATSPGSVACRLMRSSLAQVRANCQSRSPPVSHKYVTKSAPMLSANPTLACARKTMAL